MPRSACRDRTDRFIGHRRYFRRPDGTLRVKWLLAAVAAVVAVGWAAADAFWPVKTRAAHTHGELANPHAPLDSDCEACHRPFQPADSGSVFAAAHRWRQFDCSRCHANTPHVGEHRSLAADRPSHDDCGSCHRDHQGRAVSLTSMADSHCTRCHTQLPAHRPADLDSRIVSSISNFTTDHPEFRPLATPPEARTLKFSHALHMTAGLSYAPGGGEALTRTRVKELFGEAGEKRYTAFDESGLLQLECRDCHQLDPGQGEEGYDQLKELLAKVGEPTKAVLPARPAGAHFLPVNYEANCRTCHPVSAPAGVSGGSVVAGFTVAHRLSWGQTRGAVEAGYLSQLLRENRPGVFLPPGPGGRTDTERKAEVEAVRSEVGRLTATAMAALQGHDRGCAKCHDVEGDEIVPLPDRTVWLPAARFDHVPHRGVTCLSCHPGTAGAFTPDDVLVEKEVVQILGVNSCRTCHAPRGTSAESGVKHGCTDCHSYHNAEHPLQGRGADARSPARPRDLLDVLRK